MVSYFLSKYIWGSAEQQRQRTALIALSDELGLNLVKARGLRPDRVLGVVNGWYVSVSYYQVFIGFGGVQNFTQFSAYYAQSIDFDFIIKYGRSLLESKRKRFVYQTEGPEIENNYYMKTNDESKFGQFLRHASWRELLQSKVPVRLVGGTNMGLGHSELYYHSTSFVYDPQMLKSIIEYLVDTLDHMQKIGFAEAAGDKWLEQNIFDLIEKGKDR